MRDSTVPSFDFDQINVFWASGSDSVSVIFLTMICSLLDEGSLNQVSLIWLRCSFFWLDWINAWFLALTLIAVFSIRLWFAWFQHTVLWIVLFTRFKDFFLRFEQIIFCSFFLCLLLVINSVQLSPALSQSATDCANYDIGHYKFMSCHSGVIIIDFDEVPEHALLAIFSWYPFWFGNSVGVIYSRSQELTQVVSSSYFNRVTSYSVWLHCYRYFMRFRFPYAFVHFWQSLLVFTTAYSFSCTNLCKVSLGDISHVILQTVVLTAEIWGHHF